MTRQRDPVEKEPDYGSVLPVYTDDGTALVVDDYDWGDPPGAMPRSVTLRYIEAGALERRALYVRSSTSAQSARNESARNLFAWTATAVFFCLLTLPVAQWTVSWWEQRSHVVLVLLGLTTVTLYLWVRFLWRRAKTRRAAAEK